MISNYIWEKSELDRLNPVSILVLQKKEKKKESGLFLICKEKKLEEIEKYTCGESYKVLKQIEKWYHQYSKNQIIKNEKQILKKTKNLLEEKEKYIEFVFLFMQGNHFTFIKNGEMKIYFVNLKYNKENVMKLLEQEHEISELFGEIELESGLLIGTKEYFEFISNEEIKQVFGKQKTWDQNKIKKRLNEIHNKNKKKKGEKSIGGIFVYV